jgi:hypothetical protein
MSELDSFLSSRFRYSNQKNLLYRFQIKIIHKRKFSFLKKNAVFWDVTKFGSCMNRRFASIIKVTKIGELGTKLAVTIIRSTLRRNVMLHGTSSQRTSVNSYC